MGAGTRGTSLLELLLVLGILGLLSLLCLPRMPLGSPLNAVQGEFRGALEQAFLRAQAQGEDVRVDLKGPRPASVPPLLLPRGVAWGLPPGIPLPTGMKPTVQAERTGAAHAEVPVTPWHTALASVWFLNDGQDALCLRLSGHGRVTLLRWRQRERRWVAL